MFQQINSYALDNTPQVTRDLHTYNEASEIHDSSQVTNNNTARESSEGELFSKLLGISLGDDETDPTEGNWFYKDKVKHPDVFSEHEFKCCIKLGEFTTSTDACCSNHAVFVDPNEPDKGMTCRLPYGTNLNVYFNRFVSSDGLLEDSMAREDDDPIGFKLSHFTQGTGEIIPSDETDDILSLSGKSIAPEIQTMTLRVTPPSPSEEALPSETFIVLAQIKSLKQSPKTT